MIPLLLGVWVVFWSWGLNPEFLHAEQALDALPVSHILRSVFTVWDRVLLNEKADFELTL